MPGTSQGGWSGGTRQTRSVALEAQAALLAVAAGHAGFQLTVTVLVYPALAATRPEDWDVVHARHSRRITPLVVLAYGGLVLAGAWALVSEPLRLPLVLTLLAAVATVVVTAVSAAPLHGRLGRQGPRPELLRRLLVADRVRAVLAVLVLVLAVWGSTTR